MNCVRCGQPILSDEWFIEVRRADQVIDYGDYVLQVHAHAHLECPRP